MPIVCGPAGQAGAIAPVIGGRVRAVADLTAVAQLLSNDPSESLVVIDAGVFIDDALAFAARLRLDRPAVGVVLIREEIDVWLLNKAIQSGIREVVAGGDDWALASACERSRHVSQHLAGVPQPAAAQSVPEGEIITVFAPKGGVGKTTMSTNLAVVLASEGYEVCLVDLDLASGDIAITTNLDPVRTMVDAVPMAGHVDTTGASSLLTRYRPGLHMLLAPVAPGDAEKISPALVSELLGVLRTMFRYIVVDSAAYLSEHVLAAMDISSRLVLVATPDVPALKNLRVTQDMLDLLSYPKSIRSVVLNRSDSNVGLSPEDVERVMRGPIAAHIPSSRAVPLSINNLTPLTVTNREHPVSRAIAQFAQEHILVPADTGNPGTRQTGNQAGNHAGNHAASSSLLSRLRDRRRG